MLMFTWNVPNNENFQITTISGAIDPTTLSEIIIGIDLAHNNNFTREEIVNLTSNIETTFSSQNIIFLENEFDLNSLRDIDVLMLMSPTSVYTEDEIEVVKEYISLGNSLLLANDNLNQSLPINEISSQFGLTFDLDAKIMSNSGNSESFEYNYLAKNFTSPSIPLTEEMTQVMIPNGIGVSFDEDFILPNSTISPKISYFSPVLIKNVIQDPYSNNTIINSIEFENAARIVAIGSSSLFNNTYIEPLDENENTSYDYIDNTNFALNSLKWLGHNTGVMQFYDEWIDRDILAIEIGTIISGNVTLVDSENQSIPQTTVMITLERGGAYLASQPMAIEPQNPQNYFGWISTEGLDHGYIDLLFTAERIGYSPIEVRAGRFFLPLDIEGSRLPDISMIGLLVATLMIFFSTAIVVLFSKEK